MIRDEISIHVSAGIRHERQRPRKVTKSPVFRHEDQVCLLESGQRWNSTTRRRPRARPPSSGDETTKMVQIASRGHVEVATPVIFILACL